MSIARWFIVFGLILVALTALNPATRGQVQQSLEHARPTIAALVDSLYLTARTLIAGDGQREQIDDHPVAPEVDFDRIVTRDSSLLT
jgi:hypothetical protein